MNVDELIAWLEQESARERRNGYEQQIRGRRALSMAHIGREFAYFRVIAKIHELQGAAQHADDHQRGLDKDDEFRDYAEERFNASLLREE